jgi:thiamine-monophosphate kinase
MEAEFLRWLRERLPPHPRLKLGVGDDAAILGFAGEPACVVTSDMLQQGVDFRLEDVSPELVGRKALAVNLSDLAAMGAWPVGVVISLALPRANALSLAQRLYLGILPLADQFAVAVAGGDTGTWEGPLVISVTAIGELRGQPPLTRSGAVAGDAILVTGEFGGSLLGHHLQFTPRVQEAIELRQAYSVHAATDVSDGLLLDLWHIVQASRCGAELDTARVPIAADAIRLAAEGHRQQTALEHALGDGEDFELILAVPEKDAKRIVADQPLEVPVTRIGEIVAGSGLWQRDRAGGRRPLEPRGYEH